MDNSYINENIYNTVRQNIKRYRKAAKMTQQELADASGFTHGYIREIESPTMCSTFSLDAVEKIANGLKLNFKYLFDDPSTGNPEEILNKQKKWHRKLCHFFIT